MHDNSPTDLHHRVEGSYYKGIVFTLGLPVLGAKSEVLPTFLL